jgi:hypothetical protein
LLVALARNTIGFMGKLQKAIRNLFVLTRGDAIAEVGDADGSEGAGQGVHGGEVAGGCAGGWWRVRV